MREIIDEIGMENQGAPLGLSGDEAAGSNFLVEKTSPNAGDFGGFID